MVDSYLLERIDHLEKRVEFLERMLTKTMDVLDKIVANQQQMCNPDSILESILKGKEVK